ncbi:hypothetical protein ACQPYE_17915 [Actinosynnema sp. CA-299493]
MPNNPRRRRLTRALVAIAVGAAVSTTGTFAIRAIFPDLISAPFLLGLGISTTATGLVATLIIRSLVTFMETRSTFAQARRPLRSSRAVTNASRLLPADVRDKYQEEWAAWMLDLRTDGTPQIQRWIHLLSIVLIAVPRLAVTLRMAARQAVDR